MHAQKQLFLEGHMKKCPKCEKMNNIYAGLCEFCGADISQVKDKGLGDAEITKEPISKGTDSWTVEPLESQDRLGLADIYDQLEKIKDHLSRGTKLFDVNMPFGRMVMLFIKVIIAAIPAIVIVGFLFLVFWAFLGGLMFNVFFRGYGI
jgi:hypothetical protein